MKCDECGRLMVKMARRTELAEFDDGATEGQMADYFAAEESGDYGDWGIGVVHYECRHCGYAVELVMDYLPSYNDLIIAWHRKAMQGDYFSKYVFECIAFTAYIKSNLALTADRDRQSIQNLKSNQKLRVDYLHTIGNSPDLRDAWTAVIKELDERPLHNASKDFDYPEIDNWWNKPADPPHEKTGNKNGVVHSLTDWGNMVEFWYSVRNNLFHGGKEPSIARDQFLVEHAFKTLYQFMKRRIRELGTHV